MEHSVVIVSATSPLPADNGRRVFLAGLVHYLVDRLDSSRVHYGLVAGPDERMPDLPCRVYGLPKPRPRQQIVNAVVDSALRRRLSLQEAMLSSKQLRRAIADLMATLAPSLEIYDTARLAQHRAPDRVGARSIVNLDDLYSLRYERMVRSSVVLGAKFDPLGEFSNQIPRFLRRSAGVPALYRPLLRWESQRMREREIEFARAYSCSLLVNADEAMDLREQAGVSTVRHITPLVPAPPVAQRSLAKPNEIAFLGRLNVPHNDDAICSFIRNVVPALVKQHPGWRLRVVGKGASPTLRRLADAYRGTVCLEGFVDNLADVFARTTAVIAPLRFGSGVKLKVLDALAHGVPVLGTEVTFEGIPAKRASPWPSLADAESSDGCFVADDIRTWPKVLSGLADARVNAAYSEAARDFFQRSYSRDAVYAQYDDIFRLRT
jgi:glycosyltransferase involved in cell wall biosynthesis